LIELRYNEYYPDMDISNETMQKNKNKMED